MRDPGTSGRTETDNFGGTAVDTATGSWNVCENAACENADASIESMNSGAYNELADICDNCCMTPFNKHGGIETFGKHCWGMCCKFKRNAMAGSSNQAIRLLAEEFRCMPELAAQPIELPELVEISADDGNAHNSVEAAKYSALDGRRNLFPGAKHEFKNTIVPIQQLVVAHTKAVHNGTS